MEKDDATWLNVSYALFGLFCAFVAWKAVFTVGVQTAWVEKFDSWYSLVNTGVAIVGGVAGFVWIGHNAERKEYHLSVIGELRKVSWPSWEDTKKMTIIVAVVVAVFSVIVSIFDAGWAWVLKAIIA
jgi:preprotein translocase SecE subunit